MKKIFNITSFILLFLVCFQQADTQQADVYSRPLRRERSRNFDAIHYHMEFNLNVSKKAFTGENTITLSPFKDDFNKCTLDAETFTVTNVEDEDGEPLSFEQNDGKLTVNLGRSYNFGDTLSFTVHYYAINRSGPRGRTLGINFIDETENNPPMIVARSFAEGARHWFPCYDHPNDKATQEIIATVPQHYKVLSNGSLISEIESTDGGTKTYHWSQTLPHSTYLSTLVAGPFVVVKDALGDLPVTYWVYEQDKENARLCFNRTPEIIKLYSEKYGYDYPWAKYDQVTVPGGGGTECTSATMLGQSVMHNERAEQDYSIFGWLVNHEAAHQWWGDLVTCRDWGHTWINESFGTYSEIIFAEYDVGPDETALNLLGKKNQYLHEAYTRYMRPIVFHRWETPNQNFDRHTYQKGAAVIHMMRWILGEKQFDKTISHFLHKHAFQPADTHDFLTAIKEVTGQNFDWFFDQWLLSPGHPVFDVDYVWNPESKKLKVTVNQTQDTSGRIPVFKTPVIIGIVTTAEKRSEKVWLKKKEEVFEFNCSEKPLLVRFDEGNYLLKELTFEKSVDELIYQLRYDDVIGRMWAASQLARFDDNPHVLQVLVNSAKDDPFWAVRRDILYILGGYRGVIQMDLDRGNIPWTRLNEGFRPGRFSDEKFSGFFRERALDRNQKVRAAALWSLGNLRDRKLVPFLQERFKRDNSYPVQAAALVAIGKCGNASLFEFLAEARNMKSPWNIVQRAADWALEEIGK